MSKKLIGELKIWMIEGLHPEDFEADNINVDEPFFGDGLDLDSIDTRKLSVLMDKKYGVRIFSCDNRILEILALLPSLTDFVAANRSR